MAVDRAFSLLLTHNKRAHAATAPVRLPPHDTHDDAPRSELQVVVLLLHVVLLLLHVVPAWAPPLCKDVSVAALPRAKMLS